MASDTTTHPLAEGGLTRALRRALRPALGGTALALLIAGCGASGGPTSARAQARRAACGRVQAVLSDGPEPQADPVGYAEAQVLPLRQIHTSDAKLGRAIGGLAHAYEDFYASNGAGRTGRSVAAASRAIDAICPGAAS